MAESVTNIFHKCMIGLFLICTFNINTLQYVTDTVVLSLY